MPIVQTTAGELEATVQRLWAPLTYSSVRMYDQYSYDYATMYRTQPNVRVCVDFLARNIAQLGLHIYRRVSETDRVRLRDHPLAQLLARPLPAEFKLTTYRLIEATMSDLGVYFNALWLKVRADGAARMGLLRIPWPLVSVTGSLVPTAYEVTIGGQKKTYTPDQVVHFRGYNADNPVTGLSPLETLRRVLAEEYSMGQYREGYWQSAARMSGVIERPLDAPKWSDTARDRFGQEFAQMYSGEYGSGKTAILEEGMTWKEASFNAQESEYLAGRKLTREECARSYHIPLPMVGILDNATFSNIREQHKNLYQDALGPWLALLEQDLALQLLPDFGDTEGIYLEFNIAEKMQGSFEEQTTALQAAVGRPWMTADEARARMNMPSMGGDAAELVTPLNVLVGGQASPQDSAREGAAAAAAESKAARRRLDSYDPDLEASYARRFAQVLARNFRRQEAAILSRMPKGRKDDLGQGIWWDAERWNKELAADLLKLNRAAALAFARRIARQVDADVDESWMDPWLVKHSQVQAENINANTRLDIERALEDPEALEAVKHLFELALTVRALQLARDAVRGAASFGAHEGARAGGLKVKTWRVNSSNPRDAHAAMDGETVGLYDLFSNGMKWPHDPNGGAENNAGCECSVEFGRE